MLEPTLTSQLLGTGLIAIGQQYEEDLQEKFEEGYQAFQADLAYARKHSHSDNDWGTMEV